MQKLQEIMAQNADIWEKVYGSASAEQKKEEMGWELSDTCDTRRNMV